MPLLGGLFTRKNKNKQDAKAASVIGSNIADDIPSNGSSPTTSYVIADKYLPSSPNGKSTFSPGPSRDKPRSPEYLSSAPPPPPSSAPASSRLRLPFGRKKSAIGGTEISAESTPNVNDNHFYTAPRPAYSGRLSTSSAASEVESSDGRRLRPPPSKSAIFAAYGDPQSALSTHSLPNQGSFARSTSPSGPPTVPQLAAPPSKRPSIFHWSKSSTPPTSNKSQLHDAKTFSNLTQDMSPSPTSADSSSFNLKSFRHMRPPSPTRSDSSTISVSAPIPRPRGVSGNSDASQRISVAAFREAQARRSLAGSPSPSVGRSPSPMPQVPALSPEPTRGQSSPRPSRSSPQIRGHPDPTQRRKSRVSVGYTSESDELPSSDEEEESENDTVGKQRTVAPRTNPNNITVVRDRMGKARAKSEMGHGTSYSSPLRQDERSSNAPLSSRSHLGHGWVPSSARPTGDPKGSQNSFQRSQLGFGVYGEGCRPRASASTSALAPSAAAKRASIIASDNGIDVLSEYKRVSRHVRDSSTHSNPAATPSISAPTSGKLEQTRTITTSSLRPQSPADTDSDSDDDAPLATLLGPNRPGSALSSYSKLHSRSMGNVSARSTNYTLQKPLIDINELTGGKPTPPSRTKSTDGFTLGHQTLLSENKFPVSPVNSPTSMSSPLTSKYPPGNFISPPGTPAKEMKELVSGRNTIPVPTRRETSPDMLQQRKDLLSERLSKVVQKTVGAGSSSGSDGSHGKNQNHSQNQGPQPEEDRDQRARDRGRTNSASPVSILPQQDVKRSTSPRSILTHVPASAPVARGHRPSGSSATLKPSPPDEELALMLGAAGIKFISRAGESSTEEEEEEEESESSDSEASSSGRNRIKVVNEKEKGSAPEHDRIAPIPIKQRAPPTAFSVTSRPQFPRGVGAEGASSRASFGESSRTVSGETSRTSIALGESLSSLKPALTPTSRKRSSTLIPSSTTSSPIFESSTSSFGSKATPRAMGSGNAKSPAATSQANIDRATALKVAAAGKNNPASSPTSLSPGMPARQRSTTMLPSMPISASPTTSNPPSMPNGPFATRGNSPASSTGDSSSGRAPHTPRDGSDIGHRPKGSTVTHAEWSGGTSGLTVTGKNKGKQHVKRRSVSFEDNMTGGANSDEDREVKRNERRRGEARAAIELGNVINGPGPVMNDEDDDMPINQTLNARMSAFNPMMNLGGQMPMQQQMGFVSNPSLGSPWGNMNMNMGMGPQSMLSPAQFMIPPPADQNFMAAHQQAMMFAKQAYQMAVAQQAMAAAGDEWERGSTVGFSGSTVGFSGGSVYGGGGPTAGFGMMGGMGMMSVQNQWSTGSMYGGMGGSRSEYGGGGGGGGGNWSSSRSSYGDSFGPSPDRFTRSKTNQRDSGYYPPVPPIPSPREQQQSGGKSAPRPRTSSQPSSAGRGGGIMRKAPPSSWKAGV